MYLERMRRQRPTVVIGNAADNLHELPEGFLLKGPCVRGGEYGDRACACGFIVGHSKTCATSPKAPKPAPSPSFMPGDVVRCVADGQPGEYRLVIGIEYTVHSAEMLPRGRYNLALALHLSDGPSINGAPPTWAAYFADRFELVRRAGERPAFDKAAWIAGLKVGDAVRLTGARVFYGIPARYIGELARVTMLRDPHWTKEAVAVVRTEGGSGWRVRAQDIEPVEAAK